MANDLAASGSKEAHGADEGSSTEANSSNHCRRGGSEELLVEWPTRSSSSTTTEQNQAKDSNGLGESVSMDDGDDGNNSPSSSDGDRPSAESRTATSTESSRTLSSPKSSTVHFSQMVNIKIIPPLKAYSSEHIGKTYYTEAELADQRMEYVATAEEMQRRHRRGEDPLEVHEVKLKTARQEDDRQRPPTVITTATTTRGLEHMVSRRTNERHVREQRAVISAVLLAQENDFTPEEIALLYSRRARLACARATRQGMADAEHAHC